MDASPEGIPLKPVLVLKHTIGTSAEQSSMKTFGSNRSRKF